MAVSSLGGAEQIVLLMRRACEAAAPIGKPNPLAAIPATVRTTEHLLSGVPTVNTITRPAALVRQGSLKLYATSLKVRDLKRHNFYAINKLDPDDSGPGYQRLLNEGRAKRLAEYLVDGHEEDDAFLPTSIFLATSADIPFDAQGNTITFDVSEIGPFNVVDGQHRIAGLVLASDKEPALLDFELPVNIAVCLDEISQMCHFLIVNTTQRPVDKSIEQQIVARLTKMIGLEKIPTIPRWIRRQVEKGEDARALSVATYLNQDLGSPWHGKIRMANDESEGATRAIVELLIDPDSEAPSVLYKTIGVDMFHMVSATVFTHLATRNDFKKDTIKTLMKRGFQNLPDENVAMSHPEWWQRGGVASGLNSGAVRKIASALSHALNVQDDIGGVVL